MRGKLTAVLPRLRRQDGERVDPAHVRVERDRFAICGNQVFRQGSESDDEFAVGLTEARARLEFGNAVPEHCGKPAACEALTSREAEAAENRARLAPDRQDVLSQIR